MTAPETPWASPDGDPLRDIEAALSDLIVTHEEGPQPLCSSDPECACERGPLDLRARGVQRIDVRLAYSCPRHMPGVRPPIHVEIRRVPAP